MIHRTVGAAIVGLFVVSTLLLGACQLGRGGQSPPASKTYLLTLRAKDFEVLPLEPTTAAFANYKFATITAADVKDAVITAQLQLSDVEGIWEPFPYTVNGFVPGSESKRSASLTLTYRVLEGAVQISATSDLTESEMQLALTLFEGFKIRIRVVPTRAQ